MKIIKAQNVSKIYLAGANRLEALMDINLEVEEGEFIIIMGPSGSGKSTLMNIISCLDTPSSGQLWLDGQETSALSDRELATIRNQKMGFVFQTFNLLPNFTALNNVELPLIYTGMSRRQRRQRANELLELVKLSAWSHHRPMQLSGGQQQRVAIARALVNNPRVIFADEPTGNMDTKNGEDIMSIFRDLNQKSGVTIVMVTHDPRVALAGHRIIRLLDGRLDNGAG